MSSDLLCVASPEGYFLRVSPSFVASLGWSESDLLGRPFMDFVHPEDRDRTLQGMDQRTPLRGFVNRYRCADGTLRRLEWRARRGADGERMFAVGRDLTRRAEDADDEGLRRAIAESMSEAAYALRTADGIIVYTDPRFEEMFGYARGEMIGQHVSILNAHGPEDPAAQAARILGEITANGSWRGQIENVRKCGERFWSLATVRQYEHPEHGLLSVCVHSDITEAKRAGEERSRLAQSLERRQKLETLGVLAGGIAHDFNNLLTVILGNAEAGLAEVPEGSDLSRALETVRLASMQASELANQMLAYSGRSQFVIEPLDLNKVLTRMQPLLAGLLPKRAGLVWRLGSGVPKVDADATQLRQVLINLLGNAAEAVGGPPARSSSARACVPCRPKSCTGGSWICPCRRVRTSP